MDGLEGMAQSCTFPSHLEDLLLQGRFAVWFTEGEDIKMAFVPIQRLHKESQFTKQDLLANWMLTIRGFCRMQQHFAWRCTLTRHAAIARGIRRAFGTGWEIVKHARVCRVASDG